MNATVTARLSARSLADHRVLISQCWLNGRVEFSLSLFLSLSLSLSLIGMHCSAGCHKSIFAVKQLPGKNSAMMKHAFLPWSSHVRGAVLRTGSCIDFACDSSATSRACPVSLGKHFPKKTITFFAPSNECLEQMDHHRKLAEALQAMSRYDKHQQILSS